MTVLTIGDVDFVCAVSSGLASHRKGEAVRQAQSLARDITAHLSAQIGTAVPLGPTLFR